MCLDSSWLLTDVGPVFHTTDPDVFKAKIDAISVYDGGDYNELGFHGMLNALNVVKPRSVCHVFTDAGPKDEHLKPFVLAKSAHKRVPVSFLKQRGLYISVKVI